MICFSLRGWNFWKVMNKSICPGFPAPHELMRAHEVMDILEVCKLIINACLLRKSSSVPLCFERSDYPKLDPEEDNCFITIWQEEGKIRSRRVAKDYYGDVKIQYEAHNQDYKEEAVSYEES